MLVGDLVATLRLDGADAFNRGLDRAGSGMRNLSTLASGAVRTLDGVLSLAGNTANLAAGVVLGLGTSAITAGAGFNNLQQNANVALTTLMGSTDAAREQMAKLNDFANGSPFGRDTLIQAQQQMIGFGIEADNVVPYLGAVQDAVAGIGGSNQDITEIVSIISRIRSGATLGQEDLNQLADRGINAAALIAQATGQTEQEVRNSIFGNPLRGADALAGLDAMMTGMQARFDGAAAGLKNNLDGARDRVKAAMRDIGAVISAPIIDPTGGGWGVTLTNSYADILRGVQTAITPMVDELAVRMAPSLLAVNTQLQQLASSLRQVDMNDLRAAFAGVEPWLAPIAGGLAAISAQGLGAVPVIGQLVGGISPLVVGLVAAAAATPEVRAGLADIMDAARPLVPVVGEIASVVAGAFASGLSAVGSMLSAVAPLVQVFAEGVAAVPTPMLLAAAAIGAGAVALRTFNDVANVKSLSEITSSLPNVAKSFDGVRLTMMYAGDAMRDARANGAGPLATTMAGMTPIASGAAGAIGKVGGAIKTAFLANPVGIIIAGVATAVSAIAMASADAEAKTAQWQQQMETLRGTLDQTSAAITEQTESQIVQNLQATEWADRVGELNGGLWTLADMTQAVTGESTALTDELTALVDAQANWTVTTRDASGELTTYDEMLGRAGISHADMVQAIAQGGDALDALKSKYVGAGGDVEKFDSMVGNLSGTMQGINLDALKTIYDEAAKLDAAQAALEAYNDEMKRLRAEGGDAAVEQERLATAIDQASNSANDANERLRALNEILDILSGGTMSAAEQQQKLDDAIRDLGDAFDQAKDDAGNFNSALIDAQGNIDTSTEQGSQFRDSLVGIADDMKLAGIAAAEHAESMGLDPYSAAMDAMAPYKQELMSLADEYGLTDEQVNGLLTSLGMMPEEVATQLNVQDDDVSQELGTIQAALSALDEGETTINVATLSDEAQQRLDDMGFTVKELDDGTFEVSMSADTADAQLELAQLVADATGTDITTVINSDTTGAYSELSAWEIDANGTFVVPTVGADTAPAEGEVVAWKLQADGTWAVSNMDADKAKADSSVISWKQQADGTWAVSHMGADAAMAYSSTAAWKRNADGTWGRVNVSANTSSAEASLNYLARHRTVTITAVYQQTGGNATGSTRGGMTQANGGIQGTASGAYIQQFADGGFPTGIYAGGQNILKFAEPETGWEAFVSGRRGQERRNLAILAEAQQRLLDQLGLTRVRAFADGGMTQPGAPAPLGQHPASGQLTIAGPLIHVEEIIVDSDERVEQVAQALYQRADQAARAQGRISLGGATA